MAGRPLNETISAALNHGVGVKLFVYQEDWNLCPCAPVKKTRGHRDIDRLTHGRADHGTPQDET